MSDVDTVDTGAPPERPPPSVGVYVDTDLDGKPFLRAFARPKIDATESSVGETKTFPDRYLVWRYIPDFMSAIDESRNDESKNLPAELSDYLRVEAEISSLAVNVYNTKEDYLKALSKVNGTITITKEYGASQGVVDIALQLMLLSGRNPTCTTVVTNSVEEKAKTLQWSDKFLLARTRTPKKFAEQISSALASKVKVVEGHLRRGSPTIASDTMREHAKEMVGFLENQGEPFNEVGFSVGQNGTDYASPYRKFRMAFDPR